MKTNRYFLLYFFFLLPACFTVNAQEEIAVQVHEDIVWANPKGFELTLDIYEPQTGKPSYPVLIIFHGGGWLLNSKAIMSDMARYMATHGDLLVVNTNYRLLADLNNTTTANELVEDAMGAVLWVKDHIGEYHGDPRRVAVTGDSAGGHLASMVMLAGRQLESDGFSGDSLGFTPSYLPAGLSPEMVAEQDGLKLQAVVLSYTAFDLLKAAKNGFETANNPFWKYANSSPRGLFGDDASAETRPDFYRAVSPAYYVIDSEVYPLPPQLVLVGSLDPVTTPEIATRYVEQLKQAGQPVEFRVYEGKGHGFLDSGCPEYLTGCFEERAIPVLNDMIAFLQATL